mgnify:CR=1 FL=1
MENFLTWDILTTYASFISIVFMTVEFIKDIKFINKIPTKYLSFTIAFILIIITNLVMNTFKYIDLVLYFLSSISISLGTIGLSKFDK